MATASAAAKKAQKIEARRVKTEKYEETLRKIPDLNAFMAASEAGALSDETSSIGSAATTDFHTINDEKANDSKVAADCLRAMAHFFAVKHDDVVDEYGDDDDDENSDFARMAIDEMRMMLVDKLWMYHDTITAQFFVGNSAEDVRSRRAAGNNIDAILERHLGSRRTCLSKRCKDDPCFERPPPTKKDFIVPPSRKTSLSGRAMTVAGSVAGTITEVVGNALSPRRAKLDANKKLAPSSPRRKTTPRSLPSTPPAQAPPRDRKRNGAVRRRSRRISMPLSQPLMVFLQSATTSRQTLDASASSTNRKRSNECNATLAPPSLVRCPISHRLPSPSMCRKQRRATSPLTPSPSLPS